MLILKNIKSYPRTVALLLAVFGVRCWSFLQRFNLPLPLSVAVLPFAVAVAFAVAFAVAVAVAFAVSYVPRPTPHVLLFVCAFAVEIIFLLPFSVFFVSPCDSLLLP